MKLTKTGYRVSKNGTIITSIEKEALVKEIYEGQFIKKNGTYYYFNRKQGSNYIYLP